MNILTKYSSTLANDASYGSLAWFGIVSTPNSSHWGDSHAQTLDLNGSTSNYLKCTNFGFSIPTGSTIVGITVELFAYGSSNTEIIKSCKLVKNNVITATDKGDNSIIGIPGGPVNSKVFGNSTDLWSNTWTAADISSSNFGVVAAYGGSSVNSIVSFQAAVITINYISSQHNYVVSGSVILSKLGSINENFTANFGKLINSNSNSGYAVYTGGDYVSGYVTRSNTFPSGYASPGMLYASCAANFQSEIKFVTPSDATNGATISIFFRIKNISNYRYLKLQWYYDISGYYFSLSDIAVVNDVVVSDSVWDNVGITLVAGTNEIIILNFQVINNKSQVIFNNINRSSYVKLENDLSSPTINANENGVGFGFDSNERIRYITSIPTAVSFKPDYFTAQSTPYESLNIKYNSSGNLVLSGSSICKVRLKYSPNNGLILSGIALTKPLSKYKATGGVLLSGTSYSYVKSIRAIASGSLFLSKVGQINEDFSVNFGMLQNTNSDAGYLIRGAGNGGQVGDGSGGLSYNGYVTRNDSSPYAVPAILFAPSSPNFTAEIKFVCPSETTGSLANLDISLFYRVKNATNYRRLTLSWYLLTPGGSRFSLQDELCNAGVITQSSWFGISQMVANKQEYVIFKFRVINDTVQVLFNNLNTLDVVAAEKTLSSPTVLINEGGVGFGFDSDEKLQQLNSIPGSTSFKPDYFKALNIPYERLGIKHNASGSLTLSGNTVSRVKLTYISNNGLILSGNALIRIPIRTFTGGLFLSKVGLINENFSANLGILKNSNANAGYLVRGTGNGGQVGDGSGGLSYDGYVSRNNSYPSGYAVPAMLYAPSSPNFTAEMKFVCPSETTGSLADVDISLFYRVKDATNYRQLKIGWYFTFSTGVSKFYINDVTSDNGVITEYSWFGIPSLLANKYDYVIFKFRVVDDKIEVVFNNLNTLDVVSIQNTMPNPYFLANEGGVGFGFDSDEKLQHLNIKPSSTSFKPDYFKALNIPYENLGGFFNTNGGLTLSGNSLTKVKFLYTPTGSLAIGGNSICETRSGKFVSTGSLLLAGQSICITKNVKYSINPLNLPFVLSGNSNIKSTTYYVQINDTTSLLITGDANEYYRINYGSSNTNGGLFLNGTSLTRYKVPYSSNGSLILNGTSLTRYTTQYSANGGLVLGGSSSAKYKATYVSNGSLVLGSSSSAKYKATYVSNGGLVLGSSSVINNKTNYHISIGGNITLSGNSILRYKTNYHILIGGNIILSGNSILKYTFVYRYHPNIGLILISNNLMKYGVNLKYIISINSLKLLGKSKTKNRALINNHSYVSNDINVNEVKLISTKKEDLYLQWEIENNVVISKFANK